MLARGLQANRSFSCLFWCSRRLPAVENVIELFIRMEPWVFTPLAHGVLNSFLLTLNEILAKIRSRKENCTGDSELADTSGS